MLFSCRGEPLVCSDMNLSVLKFDALCCIWRRFFRTSIAQCVRIRPRRAVMYVPGTDRRKMEKVRTLNVDSAVLDLEDGVALNQKVELHKGTLIYSPYLLR